MPYMMITLLIEEEQGEAVLALVGGDCLSYSTSHIDLPSAVAEHVRVEESRAGTLGGKARGYQRTYAERPLGEAILAVMQEDFEHAIGRAEANKLAEKLGMKAASASGYLSGLVREGAIRRAGPRYGKDQRWVLVI